MCNKTRQKLCYATFDLEHQRAPLTSRWVSHFWKLTFIWVVLRTGLCCTEPFWSRQGESKWAEYPRQDRWSLCRCQPLYFTLRQPRKGAQCSPELPFNPNMNLISGPARRESRRSVSFSNYVTTAFIRPMFNISRGETPEPRLKRTQLLDCRPEYFYYSIIVINYFILFYSSIFLVTWLKRS